MTSLQQINIPEHLDSPDVPIEERKRLLLELDRSNTILSVYLQVGWRLKRFYNEVVRIHGHKSDSPFRVLEVGSGCGGLASYLIRKEIFGQQSIDYTLFDMDSEILKWAQDRLAQEGHSVKTRVADDRHLEAINKDEYDVVISLHVLHHIQPAAILQNALEQIDRVSRMGFFCADFERGRWGMYLNQIVAPLILLDPLLKEDGRRSILRSYTVEEVRKILPQKTSIEKVPLFPYFIAQKIKS